MNPILNRLCLLAVTALSAATLIACGGGGGGSAASSPSVPPAGTSVAPTVMEGTITGFGSVLINGQRFEDKNARVLFANGAEAGTPGLLADLHTGMRVLAELKDGVLQSLTVNFALVGTVGAVDAAAGTLSVFGQTIRIVNDGQLPTVFEGFTSLAQLQLGDLVRVSGSVASDGSITASRIERRLKDGSEVFRLSGPVLGLDATAKTFALLGNASVVVDYSQAKILPAGATLENGKLVGVLSLAAPTSAAGKTVITASAIEIKSRKLADGKGVAVGGVISDFQSLASLRIGDTLVDASAARLEDGTTAADVANGAQALAQGTLVSGVLKAEELKVFKQDTAIKALLVGQITDFVSLANFNLRGTNVDASQASFGHGQASDLATGTWVKVSGTLTATGVLAKQVDVTPPPADRPAKLAGALSGLDAAARRFSLLGTTVQWTDTTKILPESKSAADLANGGLVAVEGSYSAADGVFTATRIQLVQPFVGSKTVGFSGLVFDIGASSFKVGMNTVLLSADTKFEPAGSSAADLKNGQRVSVQARLTSDGGVTTLTALKVEIEMAGKDEHGDAYVFVSGLIGDFVSSASFTVAGQAVDASDAKVEFVDGDASKLANGAKVEIKGRLAGGVLKARRVHFMPA